MALKATTGLIVALLAPQVALAAVPCTTISSLAPAHLVEQAGLIVHVRATGNCEGAEPKCAERDGPRAS
jgi:hypothetical protein